MTCCILAGFAKKKKYVGTIYACDGSDLPATQDFGTVQYQGPFESAQTIPATTITYTIVGKTQCGDDIRRITTKTYSSRSVENQYILSPGTAFASAFLSPYSPANTDRAHGLGVGATSQAAINMASLSISTPLRFDYTPDPTFYSLLEGGNSTTNVILYGNYHNAVRTGGSYGWSVITPHLGTVYYLDVHEVWTYDLV